MEGGALAAPEERRLPWGPRSVLLGIAVGAALFLASALVLGVAGRLLIGEEYRTRDAGDVFEQAGRIAAYADERLAAADGGEALPEPPALIADGRAVTLALAATLILNVALIGAVALIAREDLGGLARRLGMTRFRARDMWRPALAVVGAYAVTVAYVAIVRALDIEALQPESTVPAAVTRGIVTLVLTGVAVVVVAPLAEEVFYRGLIFGGLQRWGFWPAAVISGAIFAGVHTDVGSLIPFFIIGVTLAWLFWRRGNLWESIAFHMLYNTLSFSLLVATEA